MCRASPTLRDLHVYFDVLRVTLGVVGLSFRILKDIDSGFLVKIPKFASWAHVT